MNKTMLSDACCTRAGWIEYYATGGEHELHISVDPADDLDGRIRVFDHDEQEMVVLPGWLLTFDLVSES